MSALTLRYDPTVDALAIHLVPMQPGIVDHDVELDDRRAVAYDKLGHPVSIEILDVSRGEVQLDGLPEVAAVRDALEQLAAERGWSAPITAASRVQREEQARLAIALARLGAAALGQLWEALRLRLARLAAGRSRV